MLLSLSGGPSPAAELLSPRLQIGISLLPAVIAAHKRLDNQFSDQQSLPVYLVYRDDPLAADGLKSGLASVAEIKGRPLAITSIRLDDLLQQDTPSIGAIFISEALDERLDELINFGNQHGILLFSPFKGDVERGVATGFQITDKVLPAVNMESLNLSKIELKAFLLRIAVKYE